MVLDDGSPVFHIMKNHILLSSVFVYTRTVKPDFFLLGQIKIDRLID